MTPLDIHAILEHLPHRYPMLLVDRVIDVEPGKQIHALKNVSVNEPFFNGHFPHHPVMPGDQVHLHAVMDGPVRRGMWKFSAEARVDGLVVTAASLMCTVRRIEVADAAGPAAALPSAAVPVGGAAAVAAGLAPAAGSAAPSGS